MSGYTTDYFGFFAKSTMIHLSIGWLLILGLLIGDYYGMFVSLNYRDGSMLFNDRPTLSKAFVVVWHIATIWFLVLQIHSTNLKTYFLADETLDKASYVLIEKKIQTQTTLKGLGPIVSYILSFEKIFVPRR